MQYPRYSAAHGALFFALGVGVACFFLSLFILIWLGFATGIEHLEISFAPVPKKSMSWWEIASLLVSLGLSIFTAEIVLRSLKKNSSKKTG
jgi:hypothetical protein